jgi:hypothetical protein
MRVVAFAVSMICLALVGAGCEQKTATSNPAPSGAPVAPAAPTMSGAPSAAGAAPAAPGTAPAAPGGAPVAAPPAAPAEPYPPGEPPANALPRDASRALDEQYKSIMGVKFVKNKVSFEATTQINGNYVYTALGGVITLTEDLTLAGHTVPKNTTLMKKDKWWVIPTEAELREEFKEELEADEEE